jgi:hypothetical protein
MRKHERLSCRQHNQKNAGGEPPKFENCRAGRSARSGIPGEGRRRRQGGVTKVAPSRLRAAESGLTRATATGMTLPHSDNVLNECQAEYSQCFLAAATILGRGTRLFLLH